MNLAHLSIATNGMTYYEKHLGARLRMTSDVEAYQQGLVRLRDPDLKPGDFKDFVSIYKLLCDRETEYIRRAYEASSTFIEFFNKLKTQCDQDGMSFCAMVHPWLDKFMSQILAINLGMCTWIIDKDKVKAIKTIEFTEPLDPLKIPREVQNEFEEYYRMQGGGGSRYTWMLSENDML